MFDLGWVPASITPPPTWRHATWFTVSASVAVLVGLATAAAVLVGPTSHTEYDATKGRIPDGGPLVPLGASDHVNTPAGPSGPVRPTTTTTSAALALSGHAVRTTPRPPTANAQPEAPPPRVTTLPPRGTPIGPAGSLISAATTFLNSLAGNLGSAFELADGTLRTLGITAFSQRYAGITSVRITDMVVDAGRGVVTAALQVTTADGRTGTQQRELTFTPGSEPRILSERVIWAS
ncbi:hypothetical protein D5S17_11275 [Pseudonocardiaceae bacterium YIM PH 21723]|nr:hypothetical protein D5S17_11275 [Pseudonocardiaceae bacterium YIM PH 21723]